MSNYIKLFGTQSEYQTYINGNNVLKPNVSCCKDNNEVHYNPYINYSNEYFTFVAQENSTFTFTPRNSNVISYSTDNGTTWTEGNSVTVNNGGKVIWKGTMTPSTAYPQGIGTFSATGNFHVQGNQMSLLYGDNFKNQVNLTGKDYAFYKLFNQNIKIINAEKLSLPATTLTTNCYDSMFYGCTSLVTAPELPATTLESCCYYGMFNGCTSLTTAPELPATTLVQSCYSYMFNDCTGLTTAPKLPATTLANDCYSYMFKDCTSLTKAAIVPNNVKPVSSSYCIAMYKNSNVPQSNDYAESAWGGGSHSG